MWKDRLQEIIEIVEDSNINEVEISSWWGRKIKVTKQIGYGAAPGSQYFAPSLAAPALAPAEGETASAPVSTNNYHSVLAPVVGTFYSASSPDSPPYIKVGDKVKSGQVFCIIEAMKIMNEIECDADGSVVEIRVNNAEPVEYNQVLIVIDPN